MKKKHQTSCYEIRVHLRRRYTVYMEQNCSGYTKRCCSVRNYDEFRYRDRLNRGEPTLCRDNRHKRAEPRTKASIL